MKIVDTCNYDSDYPDEKEVGLPYMSEETAQHLCDIFNARFSGDGCPRFYKAVDNDYVLSGGFEP
jgi:hypothetical protein